MTKNNLQKRQKAALKKRTAEALSLKVLGTMEDQQEAKVARVEFMRPDVRRRRC